MFSILISAFQKSSYSLIPEKLPCTPNLLKSFSVLGFAKISFQLNKFRAQSQKSSAYFLLNRKDSTEQVLLILFQISIWRWGSLTDLSSQMNSGIGILAYSVGKNKISFTDNIM